MYIKLVVGGGEGAELAYEKTIFLRSLPLATFYEEERL